MQARAPQSVACRASADFESTAGPFARARLRGIQRRPLHTMSATILQKDKVKNKGGSKYGKGKTCKDEHGSLRDLFAAIRYRDEERAKARNAAKAAMDDGKDLIEENKRMALLVKFEEQNMDAHERDPVLCLECFEHMSKCECDSPVPIIVSSEADAAQFCR